MVLGGLRQEDTAGRTGGVDFALLLVEVNADNAASIMQAIRSAIANAQFGPNRQVRVTISAGLAIWLKESTIDRSSLLKLAESQLERAKGLGGNRVCHIGGMDAA
jgi:diguanylate cyclase (GGDEF)-like protein